MKSNSNRCSNPPPDSPGTRQDLAIALLLSATTLFVTVATLQDPGMAWDEGFTISRELKVADWCRGVANDFPAASSWFAQSTVLRHWPFAREEPDGHPPFYALIGLAGHVASRSFLEPLASYRFGPALLFSVTVGIIYWNLVNPLGRAAALMGAAGWATMPRVFGHAHLASYDVPIACLWILTTFAFWKARGCWGNGLRSAVCYSILFAVTLTAALATKFTGWLIPIPLLAWTAARSVKQIIQRRFRLRSWLIALVPCLLLLSLAGRVRSIWLELIRLEQLFSDQGQLPQQAAAFAADRVRMEMVGIESPLLLLVPVLLWILTLTFIPKRPSWLDPVAMTWMTAASLSPLLCWILIPSWWHDPVRNLTIFLWSNLSRQSTTWIPTLFLGEVYEFGLPWFNTMAWIYFTVPPLTLLLAIAGVVVILVKSLAPGDSDGAVVSLGWLLLASASTLLVIRALPNAPGHDGVRQMMGCFPFLACLAGYGVLGCRWLGGRIGPRAGWVVVAVAVALAVRSTWKSHPVQLSYYSELIGGIAGAVELGLEPTYYWDALDLRQLGWLEQNTPEDSWVLFCSGSSQNFELMRSWGRFRAGYSGPQYSRPRWYVLQNRPGMFRPRDRWLAENGVPAIPPRMLDGVPLVWIFPIEQYERSVEIEEAGF